MRNHRWLKVAAAILAVILVLAGIRFVVAPAIIANPDAVHIVVTRIEPSTQDKAVIFDHRFSQRATPVYAELVAGGPLTGMWSCPAIVNSQPYYHYDLTFVRWGITTATARSDTVGCMFISVQYPLGTTEGYSWYRGNNPSFWVRLYELTGAPQPPCC